MSEIRFIALAAVATLAATPAAAQSFYQPQDAAPRAAFQADQPTRTAVAARPQSQNRFFLPFLRDANFGLTEAPARFPGGAVATTPSGRRVYYIPAPAEAAPQPVTLARAHAGDVESDAQPMPRTTRAIDPRFMRQEVAYSGPHRPGTIVINANERHLYFVMPGGRAMRYGIGVGREGFGWRGEKTVTRMAEWPDWRPPVQMLQRRPDLPRFMPGGPSNPLGARALYLGSSLYRIHGTNEPHTIGQAVSSGCFRMMNEDVTDLYNRVRVGARVVVM